MLELLNQSDYIAKQHSFAFRYWSSLPVELLTTSFQSLEERRARPGLEICTPGFACIQTYWSLGQAAIESLGQQVLPIVNAANDAIMITPELIEDGNSPELEEFFTIPDYRRYLPFLGRIDGFPRLTRELFRQGFLLSDGIREDNEPKRIELLGVVFPVYHPESRQNSLIVLTGEDFIPHEDSEALNRLIFRCIGLGNNITSQFFHDITLVYMKPKEGTFISSEVYRF